MLEELAAKYYNSIEPERNCAEALIYGANEAYSLALPIQALRIMGPFGGGMRIESVCGALTGALAVIGVIYNRDEQQSRERMKSLTETFLNRFKIRHGCLDCACLKSKHRLIDKGCEPVVRLAARLLEEVLTERSG